MCIKMCIKNAQISIVYDSKKSLSWNICQYGTGLVNYIASWVRGYEHCHWDRLGSGSGSPLIAVSLFCASVSSVVK